VGLSSCLRPPYGARNDLQEAPVINVLVIVMAVVVVVLVVASGRIKAARTRSGRDDVLAALAPVVGGSVSADQMLTGRYRGYDVQARLRMADPAPPGNMGDSHDNMVEIVELRLIGTSGAQPWYVWRSPSLMGKTWQWHFARPSGGDFLPFLGRLTRLAGLPPADPDLPDRLRAAGILDAFDRIAPPTKDSLPRIQFTPDLRSVMRERLRGVRDLPPEAYEDPAQTGPFLEFEVERTGGSDPSPERFAALLDAAIGIAEINARANPATTTA
jgi:hypothetical protein